MTVVSSKPSLNHIIVTFLEIAVGLNLWLQC